MIQLIPESALFPFVTGLGALVLALLLASIVALWIATHPSRRYFGLRQRGPGYTALFIGALAFNYLMYLLQF